MLMTKIAYNQPLFMTKFTQAKFSYRAWIVKNLPILQEWVRKNKVENSNMKWCIFLQKNEALMNFSRVSAIEIL